MPTGEGVEMRWREGRIVSVTGGGGGGGGHGGNGGHGGWGEYVDGRGSDRGEGEVEARWSDRG